MKILTTTQNREADSYTIKNKPISSTDLMEQAATACSNHLIDRYMFNIYETNKHFKIFVGPGNNGGDGLVIARLLTQEVSRWFYKNSTIKVYILNFSQNFSDDFKVNLERLKKVSKEIYEINSKDDFPEIIPQDIIVDAIFGSGLSRPVVGGLPAKVIDFINSQTQNKVVSIDIPSGMFGEENHQTDSQKIIKADYTITFEFPFLSFFFPENQEFIGEFAVIPIGIHPDFVKNVETDYFLTEKKDVQGKIKKRKKFAHKGDFGHGFLIAGRQGKTGAAILAAKAALRAGVGLLTAYNEEQNIALNIASPETMITNSLNFEKYSAVAIGPGLGLDEKAEKILKKTLKNSNLPLVIDADAITLLAKNEKLLEKLPKNSILTPHIKEFERLVGKTKNNYQRNLKQIEFSRKFGVYIVLKGAYTAISTPDGKCFFNTTGNPGMATGGSGDALTGILLSLLAQGYNPQETSTLGVYLHGLSGDLATKKTGEYSLLPSDLIEHIAEAIKKL